jgi:hypothetical protein
MRLNIDLGKEDLEELLYINVNYRIMRRMLPIIKVVAPELCKKYAIKWRYVMQEFGKGRTPKFTYERDMEVRYGGDEEHEENDRKHKIAHATELLRTEFPDLETFEAVRLCGRIAKILGVTLEEKK